MGFYLADLYRLGAEHEQVSVSRLAKEMGVSPPAVSRMSLRLASEGLVDRQAYQGLKLTASGRRAALRTIRAHRLAEAFLVTVMDYGWHESHDLADALASVADAGFVDRMEAKAGYPKRCPHGEPIPSADGVMPELDDFPLVEMEVGARGVISRVKLRNPEKLIYLADIGLRPGSAFRVEGKAPFRGPVRLRIGRQEHTIAGDLAARLWVEHQPPQAD